MRTEQFIQAISQLLFLLIFAATAVQAVRRPLRSNIDIAVFFGLAATVITESWLAQTLGVAPGPVFEVTGAALILAMPYALLRLLDDFAGVPWPALRTAEAGLVACVAGLALLAPRPIWLILLCVVYFCTVLLYATVAFVQQARRARGVTQRRMQAVAAGSLFLAAAILIAGLRAAAPAFDEALIALGRAGALASGLAYFLGFATPGFVRRAWQEPALRGFLREAAQLPRLTTLDVILAELERRAAETLGAPYAAVGLWDETRQTLRFRTTGKPPPGLSSEQTEAYRQGIFELRPGEMIAGRAFEAQRALFFPQAAHDDPQFAALYRAFGATAVLAAPITAGTRRLGVLVVYAPRAPLFAEDDLELVQLLADQAAVVLESRTLIDEAARVRAREEAARLKEDFLSAAAHDLQTPLTTLLAQAQLLERRALRHPDAPADLVGVRRLVREARRLRSLVLEFIDVTQGGQETAPLRREPVDLATLAREACARFTSEQHTCVLEGDPSVAGICDPVRIRQVLDNLLENAVKYSPDGGVILVRVWQSEGWAHLTVTDSGIGIPPGDVPHLFERFRRGTNVDDRRFAGMGLGLYICRSIVEQHGGRIHVESVPGKGTTVHVTLPLALEDVCCA